MRGNDDGYDRVNIPRSAQEERESLIRNQNPKNRSAVFQKNNRPSVQPQRYASDRGSSASRSRSRSRSRTRSRSRRRDDRSPSRSNSRSSSRTPEDDEDYDDQYRSERGGMSTRRGRDGGGSGGRARYDSRDDRDFQSEMEDISRDSRRKGGAPPPKEGGSTKQPAPPVQAPKKEEKEKEPPPPPVPFGNAGISIEEQVNELNNLIAREGPNAIEAMIKEGYIPDNIKKIKGPLRKFMDNLYHNIFSFIWFFVCTALGFIAFFTFIKCTIATPVPLRVAKAFGVIIDISTLWVLLVMTRFSIFRSFTCYHRVVQCKNSTKFLRIATESLQMHISTFIIGVTLGSFGHTVAHFFNYFTLFVPIRIIIDPAPVSGWVLWIAVIGILLTAWAWQGIKLPGKDVPIYKIRFNTFMKWHFFYISLYLIGTFVHSSDDIELIITLVFMFEWVFIEKMWVRWGKRRELRTVNAVPNDQGSQVFVIEFPINPNKDKWLLWNPGDCIGVVCELINQEEHIFTIASSPYCGKLRLCIQITHAEPERDINPLIGRTVKQWTTQLGKKIRKSTQKNGVFIPFLLSPPLPTHSGIYTVYDNIIFITSGTGITPGLAVMEHWVYVAAKKLDKKNRMFELVRMYRTHKSMEFSDKIFLGWEPVTGAKWNNGTLICGGLTAFSISLLSGENAPCPAMYKETALRINLTGKNESRELANKKKVAILYMLIKEFKKKQGDNKWNIFFCGAEAVAKLVNQAAWLNKKSVIAEMF